MDKDHLTLKRAATSRPSGTWYDDDFDVLCNGEIVGRIMKAAAAPVGQPWLWTLVLFTKAARRRTAMSRHARLRWRPLARA